MTHFVLTRRLFLQLIGGAVLAGAGGFGYARLLEPNWVDVEQVTLRLPGLAESLAGLCIAQISDIHISDDNPAPRLYAVIKRIKRLQPDLVVLTGDYVGSDVRHVSEIIDPLRLLEAPAYAVYGNHDLWVGHGMVYDALAETPVRLLVNESVEAAPGLTIAGVDDVQYGFPRLGPALADAAPRSTNLLLCHQPDFIDVVRKAEAPVTLQLSGHSHGGQIRLPTLQPDNNGSYTYAPVLPIWGRRYPIGHYQVGPHQLYTNRGLGVWPVPFRFNCRPEITVFTLQAA